MSSNQRTANATFAHAPELTGRDGAIDYAGKSEALSAAEPHDDAGDSQEERFAQALGRAVIATWSDLAQADQERIFECAVVMGHHDERDEMLREQLARFLHDRHERTAHPTHDQDH
jgi:hypothetical protein